MLHVCLLISVNLFSGVVQKRPNILTTPTSLRSAAAQYSSAAAIAHRRPRPRCIDAATLLLPVTTPDTSHYLCGGAIR